MGSMDALNDALQMGSTEQLALPDVEDDFDIQNLAVQQDQLGSSPLTSVSTNGNNPKELKFEQKKVTSSSKTKVSVKVISKEAHQSNFLHSFFFK